MGNALLLCCLLTSARATEAPQPLASNKVYLGAFGGGGSVEPFRIIQAGTAYYTLAKGGPLAVDAIGKSNSSTLWIAGGHLGYKWPVSSQTSWSLVPAIELEGFYFQNKITSDQLHNATTRLPTHDFRVAYPMRSGVFLLNALLNMNPMNFKTITPYVGLGFGMAVEIIKGAVSNQIRPPEPGINHYSANTDDASSSFAAQTKLGLKFKLSQNTNIFIDYRFIYLSATEFTFGSTAYLGQAATRNWVITMDSQFYNVGTVGLQFDV
jgi:opacity protein-like surface antigen